jgi:hypothetical protein
VTTGKSMAMLAVDLIWANFFTTKFLGKLKQRNFDVDQLGRFRKIAKRFLYGHIHNGK